MVSLSGSQYKNCQNLKKKLRHHGFFVAYAPSHDPQIIVAALTENTCSGSLGATPVVRDIIQAWNKMREDT